jgi:cell division protein ZapA
MAIMEVKIMGQRYRVKSEESEEYLGKLADYVNQQLTELQQHSSSVNLHNLAILTALNLADGLFKCRERQAQTKREMGERIRRILGQIESNMEGHV